MLDPQDQYTFESKLGFGGQGAVYRAHDTYLDRIVAIKTIPTRVSEEIDDVLREARINSRLRHPNIVEIITLVPDKNSTNIVMELLPGSLKDYLENAKDIDLDASLNIVAQVCSAINYAHQQHIYHRDLKPANILMTEDGTPKVSDFGLSRAIDTQLYTTIGMSGTPAYMAPELFQNSVTIGPAGDIYAIGAMLYELIVGEIPIKPAPDMSWDRAHREIDIAFPNIPEIPDQVKLIVLKALAKRTEDRYSNISDMLSALNSIDLDGIGYVDYTQRQIDKWTNEISDSFASAHIAFYNRGLMMSDQGDSMSAIDDFTKALDFASNDAESYFQRGYCYNEISNHQMAIDDYTEAIRIGPDYADSFYNRACSHAEMGNHQLAIDDCNEAIRIDPDYAHAFYNRAISHRKLSNQEQADADYAEAIRLDPSLADQEEA